MFVKFTARLFLKKKCTLGKELRSTFFRREFSDEVVDKEIKKKLNYLLVLDFEATCDKQKIQQEIIEFPCLKINVNTMKEEGRFHSYVRPILHPRLTLFCTELTGIMQEMVDDEMPFPNVFESFQKWSKAENITEENSLFVTSGDWDLGHMLPLQCGMYNIDIPKYMTEWIDIKKLYGNNFSRYCGSLIQIIKAFDLEFEGRQHSGIDDCRNIHNLLKKFAVLGIEFTPTSKLEVTGSKKRVLTYGSRKFTEPILGCNNVNISKR